MMYKTLLWSYHTKIFFAHTLAQLISPNLFQQNMSIGQETYFWNRAWILLIWWFRYSTERIIIFQDNSYNNCESYLILCCIKRYRHNSDWLWKLWGTQMHLFQLGAFTDFSGKKHFSLQQYLKRHFPLAITERGRALKRDQQWWRTRSWRSISLTTSKKNQAILRLTKESRSPSRHRRTQMA